MLKSAVSLLIVSITATIFPTQAPAQQISSQSHQVKGGAVFVLTNNAENNAVITYHRGSDGRLWKNGSVSTRGNGTGSVLNSQGALILNPDHTRLYACNAGSDEISVFAVFGSRLKLIQKVASGGDLPVSLSLHGNLLYALNAATASIFGFQISSDGTLTALANSMRMLSTGVGAAAEISFNPEGDILTITNKVTDLLVPPQKIIDTFAVDGNGLPSALPKANESQGVEPFGFEFRNDGIAVVSEAFNGRPGLSALSSYKLSPDGTLTPISASVPTSQTAACWIVITKDEKFVFTTNAGSGTISSFAIAPDGSLSLVNATAANIGPNSMPFDMDLGANGKFLYVLLTGAGKVAAYRVNQDGSLNPLGEVFALRPMAGANGLAAY